MVSFDYCLYELSEGLEKMEREKLKQSEREKELRGREEQLELKKRVEKEAMEELQAIKEKRAKGKMVICRLKVLISNQVS